MDELEVVCREGLLAAGKCLGEKELPVVEKLVELVAYCRAGKKEHGVDYRKASWWRFIFMRNNL